MEKLKWFISEVFYEVNRVYRIWKNGCKKCVLFDECFDYLDGKRCFKMEKGNDNR